MYLFFLQKLMNLAVSRPDSSNCHGRDGVCRHHTSLYARRRTFFSCAHHSAQVTHLIRIFPMLSHRHWLKVKGISVAHFSKTLSSLRHLFVSCSFRSFPSCRIISYLFFVTTFSVIDLVGEDQINPSTLLTRVECQSDSKHIFWVWASTTFWAPSWLSFGTFVFL